MKAILLLLALARGIAFGQPFPTNVVVTLVQRGEVSLAWDRAPSHTNLEAFVILIGVESGAYNVRQDVAANVTTAMVTNLPVGRFFFAVIARNFAKLESDPSNEVSVVIEKPVSVPSVRTTQLRAGIEGALRPDGPWVDVMTFPAFAVADVEHRFFRMRLGIERGN